MCCINKKKKTGGDGILNILSNHCTDNNHKMYQAKNVFAQGITGFSERNIANTTVVLQIIVDKQANVSDSNTDKSTDFFYLSIMIGLGPAESRKMIISMIHFFCREETGCKFM